MDTNKETPQEVDLEEPLNLKAVLFKHLHYWRWYCFSLFICLFTAFLYLRYCTPEYSISGTILIKDDKKAPDITDNTALNDIGLFQSSKNIDNEIEVLKGKSLMQRVLKELNLEVSYFEDGTIKSTELYGRTSPIKILTSRIDSSAYSSAIGKIEIYIKDSDRFSLLDSDGKSVLYKFGQTVRRPYATFVVEPVYINKSIGKTISVKFNDIRKLGNSYSGRISVTPVNKTASVLTLSLVDPVRDKGTDIINKLVDVYNREEVEDKNLIASNTILFIDGRLKYLVRELSDVERDVERYKKKNEVTDVSSEAQDYLKNASDYGKRLADHDIQINVLESLEAYLHRPGRQYDLVPSNLSAQDVTLTSLIAKFNELQLERKRILTAVQPESPVVAGLNEQISALRINILENLRNIKNEFVITKNKLKESSSSYESRIQNIPSIERELLEIQRQKSIKEGLYTYLLQKREESAISLASTVSNSRIIDKAMAGDTPVKPQEQLIYLTALAFGVGLPIAIIYIRDLLNDKVICADEVKAVTGMPILGEIAHAQNEQTLVITQKSRSPISEMFRLIRSNLEFASIDNKNRVILVTSSMSGEGKTFFCLNLGASLALTGKRTILLEFDIRKAKLLRGLGIDETKNGIVNYLVSDALSPLDLVQTVPEVENLFVIGAGPVPPNPGEMLLSKKISQLISTLDSMFDYIIIDTSPVGLVADTFSLTKYSDMSIYMVRYNYTLKNQLGIIRDIYESKKLRNPFLVLNDAKRENTYGYGYGYGYGYNGYSGYNGYGEEEEDNLSDSVRKLLRIKVNKQE